MKGILFKPEMIQAIRAGRKTVTRRIIKPQPPIIYHSPVWLIDKSWAFQKPNQGTPPFFAHSRYLSLETVYVKETWADMICLASTEKGKGKGESSPIYKLDADSTELKILQGHWKSPMMMPEWAARTFLLIEDVRPERLQEITENEALSEGIDRNGFDAPQAVWNYKNLWDSINKPPYDWKANPWVWRIQFKVKEKRA